MAACLGSVNVSITGKRMETAAASVMTMTVINLLLCQTFHRMNIFYRKERRKEDRREREEEFTIDKMLLTRLV